MLFQSLNRRDIGNYRFTNRRNVVNLLLNLTGGNKDLRGMDHNLRNGRLANVGLS